MWQKIGTGNGINRLDEDFWLQYYDGSTWHTVATYVCGTDFNNGEFYNNILYIDEVNYAFPADMKIRFMCDAGDNRNRELAESATTPMTATRL